MIHALFDAREAAARDILACWLALWLAVAPIYAQTARISPDAAFPVTDWAACVIFIVVIAMSERPILGVLDFSFCNQLCLTTDIGIC